MIKKNKWQLIISSIVILLPMLLGVFGSKILPEEIAVHWGFDGNADGWMNSSLIFFVLPAIMLTIHWLCIIFTLVIDKNNKHNNQKLMNIMFWVIPVISLSSCGMIFTTALGYTSHIYAIILAIIGIFFIIIGNYMPKTTRNITMGIKVRWALASDENWYATHRFAGKVYVTCGFLCFLAMPLPSAAFLFVGIALIVGCAVLPIIYSYRFYKKQLAEGKLTKDDAQNAFGEIVHVKNKKLAGIITVIGTLVLIVVLSVIMFTGNVEATLDDDSLDVKATFWGDLSLKYEHIDSIEYREDGVDGHRISGWGSARLLLGNFKNDELGMYTRYTYTGDCPCVIIKSEGRNYVIGVKDAQTVKEIYERISAEIGN